MKKNGNLIAVGCVVIIVLMLCGVIAAGALIGTKYLKARHYAAQTKQALETEIALSAPTATATFTAVPTLTPAPTSTSKPLPTMRQATATPTLITSAAPTTTPTGQTILTENFDNPAQSDWETGALDNGYISLNNGTYLLRVTKENYLIWASHSLNASDMVISVDAQIADSQGKGDFGILCRGDGDKNYYAFEVSADGQYSIWKLEDGKMDTLVPWTALPKDYDKLSPRKAYRLTAVCSDNLLAFAINDTWIDSLEDDTFPSGNFIGLLAGTPAGVSSFAVQFDNLTVSAPPTVGLLPSLPQGTPAPMPTPLPEAAPTPVPTSTPSHKTSPTPTPAVLGKLLFADDFSDKNSGWDSYHGSDYITDYSPDGTYHIKVMESLTDVWANPSKTFPANVIVEATAIKISGTDDNDFGIICRYQNSDNFYFLVVGSDGYYAIGEYKNGDDNILTDDYSDKIPLGSKPMLLRGECIGNTLTLWVNGQFIASVKNSDLTHGGDVGLIAGTYDTPNVEIGFDDFKVYAPKR